MKLYTRTGDRGETMCPIGFRRVPKNHPCIELYGELDEAQAWLGLTEVYVSSLGERFTRALRFMQELLFRVGFALAGKKNCISDADVDELERIVDELWGEKKLDYFTLHGGSVESAIIGVTRAMVRRLERRLVDCASKLDCDEDVLNLALRIVNRMSDALYALEIAALEVKGLRPLQAPSC